MNDPNRHDLTSERALIGTMMYFPDEVREAFLSVRADDWFRPVHGELSNLIREMLANETAVDPNTVLTRARDAGISEQQLPAKYILDCYQQAGVPASAEYHADRIRKIGATRRLGYLFEHGAQRVQSVFENGVVTEDDALYIDSLREMLDEVENANRDETEKIGLTIGEILDIETRHQWVIPGLLAHMDRVILTGAEGAGKSTLMTQIAAALIGEIHPFTGMPLTDCGLDQPPRVLVLDFENSELQLQARARMILPMVDACRANHGLPPINPNVDHVLFVNKPEGIDLAGKQADSDLNWIETKLHRFQPHILIMGPLYRMHSHESSNEEAARAVTVGIDRLRARYRFALLTEAHAAKATTSDGRRNMAPIGTSLWLRWPEFGLGLLRSAEDPNEGVAKIVDVVRWRGEREKRLWPKALQRSHKLPWTPYDADYYADERHFRNTGEMPE